MTRVTFLEDILKIMKVTHSDSTYDPTWSTENLLAEGVSYLVIRKTFAK